ncbi:MAG: ornithine cyclodeaminase [Clostridia bacterium]|nr:ornithine cyclodeaminase [Clostridia bacterium]
MIKIFDFETCKALGNELPSELFYQWVDFALKEKEQFVMPVKTRIGQDHGDYYASMPCMYEKDNLVMAKMIGRHILKEGEQRSTMMSDLMLYEADTGVLKALMDCEYITTLRTGAAAAHSAMMYAKKDFKTVGLLGLGNIMFACIDVLMSQIQDREVTFKLYKYHDHEKRFMERFSKFTNITFELCDTYEETIRDSDLIISAVTRVTENFVSDDCYKEGCTVIPIMTLGFQNCDLFFDKVFADDIDQIRGFKYFDQFKSIENTTDVLNGTAPGRENDTERILVYNYGLAIHDLYFAAQLYNHANGTEQNIEYHYCKEKFFM